jgi:hypothetical protein
MVVPPPGFFRIFLRGAAAIRDFLQQSGWMVMGFGHPT